MNKEITEALLKQFGKGPEARKQVIAELFGKKPKTPNSRSKNFVQLFRNQNSNNTGRELKDDSFDAHLKLQRSVYADFIQLKMQDVCNDSGCSFSSDVLSPSDPLN